MMFKNDAHEEEPNMQGSLDDNKQNSGRLQWTIATAFFGGCQLDG